MKYIRVPPLLRPGTPSPIMPVDVAVTMRLAGAPPPRCQTGCSSSRRRPLRPCLSSGRCDDAFGNSVAMVTQTSPPGSAEGGGGLRWLSGKKKSVVFADSRGLTLAAVHVFSEADDEPPSELQFQLTEVEGAAAGVHLREARDTAGPGLVLDFIQPVADYLDLRNRLKAQQVCLETCSVQEGLLSGTVQVQNLCFNKSVSVRITFDSWQSFQDVPCLYLKNVYGCPNTDTFTFSISILVPDILQPSDRVEFCIKYQTQDQTFWDNNHGNNYGLVVASSDGSWAPSAARLEVQSDARRAKREDMEFDPFGSPRTSAGIFPEWQSWGHMETSAPYW